MKTKHTQGEWTKHGIHSINRHEVVRIKSGNNVIADVSCLFDGKNNLEKGKEAESNAKLIAAAPELLEALEKVSNELYALMEHCYDQNFIDADDDSIEGVKNYQDAMTLAQSTIKKSTE